MTETPAAQAPKKSRWGLRLVGGLVLAGAAAALMYGVSKGTPQQKPNTTQSKLEDAAKKAEEARKAEETRKAEEARKAEETKKVEEAKREETRKAEEAKKTEAEKIVEAVYKFNVDLKNKLNYSTAHSLIEALKQRDYANKRAEAWNKSSDLATLYLLLKWNKDGKRADGTYEINDDELDAALNANEDLSDKLKISPTDKTQREFEFRVQLQNQYRGKLSAIQKAAQEKENLSEIDVLYALLMNYATKEGDKFSFSNDTMKKLEEKYLGAK